MSEPQPAKRPLRYLFVRHGESFSNLDHTYNLTVPNESIALTPRGWEQAHACGQFLKQYLAGLPDLSAVVFAHSSYNRARQTAQAVFDAIMPLPGRTRLRVEELDLLTEHHIGYLHGMPPEEIAREHPYLHARHQLHVAKGSYQFAPYHGGETRATVGHRAMTFLETTYQQHALHGVDTFIIVSHGRLMQQFAKILNGLPRETIDAGQTVGNCDVHLFQRYDGGFGDFGTIYRDGAAQAPDLQEHESAEERLVRGAYRQSDV